jgi:hypothetical protein
MDKFKFGDRVKHLIRNEEGRVYAIEEDGLHIHFDNPTPRGNISVGIFDDDWFLSHPDVLVNLTNSVA